MIPSCEELLFWDLSLFLPVRFLARTVDNDVIDRDVMDLVSNDRDARDLVSNDCVASDLVSRDREARDLVSYDLLDAIDLDASDRDEIENLLSSSLPISSPSIIFTAVDCMR